MPHESYPSLTRSVLFLRLAVALSIGNLNLKAKQSYSCHRATNHCGVLYYIIMLDKTRSHAIAKMTARCAQYYECPEKVCKRKISRRLRKNLHITILSLFGGEIIFEVFQPMWSRYLNVTDVQTDGHIGLISLSSLKFLRYMRSVTRLYFCRLMWLPISP